MWECAAKMLGGKMAKCKMGHVSPMSRTHMGMMQAQCNHHVELHVYARGSGMVVKNATVHIRLHCIKNKMNFMVPIMRMEGAHMGAMDYHYGNNMHLPNKLYNVYVRVNGISAEFPLVHLR